jgi:acyl carrier protein
MDENKKLSMLEDMLDMEEGSLTVDMQLGTIEEYDSMAKLALMALMKTEFDKYITVKEINKFVTVQDVLNYME